MQDLYISSLQYGNFVESLRLALWSCAHYPVAIRGE